MSQLLRHLVRSSASSSAAAAGRRRRLRPTGRGAAGGASSIASPSSSGGRSATAVAAVAAVATVVAAAALGTTSLRSSSSSSSSTSTSTSTSSSPPPPTPEPPQDRRSPRFLRGRYGNDPWFPPAARWRAPRWLALPSAAAVARCDAPTAAAATTTTTTTTRGAPSTQVRPPSSFSAGAGAGADDDHNVKEVEADKEEPYYHGMFPIRQLFRPKVPYPLWDKNWDGREPPGTGNKEVDRESARHLRRNGITRHIILVRHGQYDEDEKEDDKRRLTELGRLQAELTGKRLRDMIEATVGDGGGGGGGGGATEGGGTHTNGATAAPSAAVANTFSCRIKALRVSDMTRAKETADIIASFLPVVVESEAAAASATTDPSDNPQDAAASVVVYQHGPDPTLNEGRPCHHIPGVKATPKVVEVTDDNHRRIEGAFRRYFYRADPPAPPEKVPSSADDAAADNATTTDPPTATAAATAHPVQEHHEFEIIVCHANVIRYFVCRALQLPPEAWLRFCPFNCSLTYLTIRPTGSVSCRLLGDVGHIPYPMTSFSKHLGYNW